MQVEDAMTRKQQGTGLGLPIVKTLAERQGARFRLDSVYGEGTRVSLEFPLARLPAVGAAPQAGAGAS